MNGKAVYYAVICTIENQSKVSEWVDWLEKGHIDDVKKGGATDARIIRHDPEEGGTEGATTLEVQYIFPDRQAFDHYVAEYAPKLRQEGLEKFPPEDGFSYARRIGEVFG